MNRIKNYISHNLLILVLLVAVTLLGYSNFKTHTEQNLQSNRVLSYSDTLNEASKQDSLANTISSNIGQLLPAMDCDSALQSEPESEIYEPNPDFDISFIPAHDAGKFFQDINGDNLPDFVYVKNSVTGYSSALTISSVSCVYLNDGSGFAKAYDCLASTTYDNNQNQITNKLYRGGCAGPAEVNAIK